MAFTTLILLALLVVLLVLGIAIYNKLTRLRNAIANAFAQIDVQLKRRYDLIPNLVETARKYLQHERETLEAVIAARNQAQAAAGKVRADVSGAGNVAALGAAEAALGGALGKLMVVVEAYPELKADRNMREFAEELTSTENRIGFARQAYNDDVLAYNDAAMQFPSSIVARLCAFDPAATLQSTQSAAERSAPAVRF
jgi:LemA protein